MTTEKELLPPGVRSSRRATNRLTNVEPIAITHIPRATPSLAAVERRWREEADKCRSKLLRAAQADTSLIGTRWFQVWESHSEGAAKVALRELTLRVFRIDDPDWHWVVTKKDRMIYIAVFPKLGDEWTGPMKQFHESQCKKRTREQP
jgi:hypothetical protein